MNIAQSAVGVIVDEMLADTKHAPKFCRTRNCSLPFGHDGTHDGAPTPVAAAVVARSVAKGRRIAGTYKRASR